MRFPSSDFSLKPGDSIEVIAMASEDECQNEMFVTIRWNDDKLAIPLSQLTPVEEVDEDTIQAVEDWAYWVARGYQF